jgi:hypothetical protein
MQKLLHKKYRWYINVSSNRNNFSLTKNCTNNQYQLILKEK